MKMRELHQQVKELKSAQEKSDKEIVSLKEETASVYCQTEELHLNNSLTDMSESN